MSKKVKTGIAHYKGGPHDGKLVRVHMANLPLKKVFQNPVLRTVSVYNLIGIYDNGFGVKSRPEYKFEGTYSEREFHAKKSEG